MPTFAKSRRIVVHIFIINISFDLFADTLETCFAIYKLRVVS